jgi:hypothetical protein
VLQALAPASLELYEPLIFLHRRASDGEILPGMSAGFTGRCSVAFSPDETISFFNHEKMQ